ncbi:hypothetical protein Golomagni_07045, partial [Golovinomyces magnicellulatus]
ELPTELGPGSTTAFQLITFNELFETAFFGSLVNNITTGVPGYEAQNKDELLKIFKAVLAQEEEHALAAQAALKTANQFVPQPCQYKFPVAKLADVVNLAETFTAIVLGALQGAQVLFAKDQKFIPLQLISSVIGQEGEQNGFYRIFLEEVPSESPFLTPVPAAFAWTALQMFVVPGSCPFELSKIPLPIFAPLTVNGGPIAVLDAKDQEVSFSADLTHVQNAQKYFDTPAKGLYLTYTSGQSKPISVPLKNVQWCAGEITFSADFPFEKNVLSGFTHAALTTANNFQSSDAIVDATLAAPAVIQVKNPVQYKY